MGEGGCKGQNALCLSAHRRGETVSSETLSLVFRSLIRIFNQLLLLEDTLAFC